jgi:diguanylate cyclase (GGDEF)-like protein
VRGNAFTLPYVVSALVFVALVVYSWRHRRGRAVTAAALIGVSLGAGWWSVCAAVGSIELPHAVTGTVKLLAYPGIALLVASFVCLARSVVEVDWAPSRRVLALLAVEPVAVTALALTNPWHQRFYGGPGAADLGDPQLWRHEPAFWLHTGYSYVLLVVGVAVLARGWWRAPRVFRRQRLSLLVAALVPLAMNVLDLTEVVHNTSNPTPIGFAVTASVVAYAIFRQDVISFAPVARELVVDRISEYVMVISPDGRMLDINPAAEAFVREMNPAAPTAIVGARVEAVLGSTDIADLRRHERTNTDRVVHGRDRTVELQVSSSRLVDRRGLDLGVVLVSRDVTEANRQRRELAEVNVRLADQLRTIEALREDLAEQASRDHLTGLVNRRHLMAGLESALRADVAGGVAVLMVDVDHFKQVNDRWGHRAGDDALVHLARVLREVMPAGSLVGRWGGEEFLVVLVGPAARCARELAEALRERCARESAVTAAGEGLPRARTVSVGVAVAAEPLAQADALVDAADAALYEAKHAGRDCVRVHHPAGTGDVRAGTT